MPWNPGNGQPQRYLRRDCETQPSGRISVRAETPVSGIDAGPVELPPPAPPAVRFRHHAVSGARGGQPLTGRAPNCIHDSDRQTRDSKPENEARGDSESRESAASAAAACEAAAAACAAASAPTERVRLRRQARRRGGKRGGGGGKRSSGKRGGSKRAGGKLCGGFTRRQRERRWA